MDRRTLYNQFLEKFPMQNLGNMTLDEYTNLNRDNSFCYWLESKTYDLGSIWGGSSYKFGIYRFDKRPDNPTVVVSDEEYAWYKKYNASNRDEAFNVVLKAIMRIATAAYKGDFQTIEDENTFGNVIKWKIAFLYAKETLLPIYKRDMLEKVASQYGYPEPSKAKIYELQEFLMKQKGEKDLFDFYEELLGILEVEQSNTKTKVWLFAPGENACMWDECKESQTMRLGWDPIGDLSEYKNREELTKALQVAYKKEDASFKNDRKNSLRRLMIFFDGVDYINPSMVRWDHLRYDRNSRTYQMVHSLCYFILQNLLLSTEPGNTKMPQFSDEHMNLLFQRFVMEYYKKHHPEYKAAAKQIKWNFSKNCASSSSILPIMQSDITLTLGVRTLIIDTKYYSKNLQEHFSKFTINSPNFYQIHTYVMNEDRGHAGIVDGMLLYAKTTADIQPDGNFMTNDGNILMVRTLDLTQEFESIKNNLDSLVIYHI